jgi:hypothetical protein
MIMKKLILLATLCLAISCNTNINLIPEWCSMYKGKNKCKTNSDCNMMWDYCDEICKKCRPRDDGY